MSNYLEQLKLEAQERAKWKEIEYSETVWNNIFALAEYKGGSLHCDEWTFSPDHETKYRLTECVGNLRTIEVYNE